jgi:UDP-2,3-diacylglucosamine hydrolase
MIEAVFISDLHLHPKEPKIIEFFFQFIRWAETNTQSVYILGDFFHVWPGDDALDEWSLSIAEQLSMLASKGVQIYFMPGNRDFLLGSVFARLASMTLLKEPTVISLGNLNVLLVHGDRYCTKDKSHQWLRRLTRNSFFPKLFLSLPYNLRAKLVNKVRQHSQENSRKPSSYMDIVVTNMLKHMRKHAVNTIIHGHTHKPGLTTHEHQGEVFRQYVLSDWDDRPFLLCYNRASGLIFTLFTGK